MLRLSQGWVVRVAKRLSLAQVRHEATWFLFFGRPAR